MASTSNTSDALVTSTNGVHKFTRDELREAFERVESKKHWKAPIAVVVEVDRVGNGDGGAREVSAIQTAVEFFTATKATFEIVHLEEEDAWIRVTAPGYWAGPAA